ncbi:hypothetical protein BDV93DRAFT_562741 [Ceratobasidium sp. AG-I]|nr:hypothetical protein BDV93DRAFT_562741 [Ceratobasidium sp. AG-I]
MPYAVDDAQLKPRLDENLDPIKKFNLRQWNNKFNQLTSDDLVARDVFALTGRYKSTTNGNTYRAGFDEDSCRLVRGIRLGQVCDVDSVLGVIWGDFPIREQINFKYFMLVSFTHTLTSNLHIPGVKVYDQDEEIEESVELHRIPNARFGEMSDNILVRIFFPNLRHETRGKPQPNLVSQAYMKDFYDKAVQPAAEATMPMDLRRSWPADYDSEMFRARNHTRDAEDPGDRRTQPQHSGRDVHARYLNPWINDIRRRVTQEHDLSFARGFFFLVEGKGMKNKDGVAHQPPEEPVADEEGYLIDDENLRTLAVKRIVADFDSSLFVDGDWFLDMATTLCAEDESEHPLSVFASADAHPQIIDYFSDKGFAQCQRWVDSNSGGYHKDELAHLGAFAGLRMTFKEPGEFGIHYLQVYSSEKSLTYRADAVHKAKRTSVSRVLSDWQQERQNFFIPLQSAWTKASATHSTAVRIESRVPFNSYPYVHLHIPNRFLISWLRYTNNSAYWGFKSGRLMAINNVLNRIMKVRGRFTLDKLPEVGSLIVECVWMANCLVHRPDEGSHWKEVCDAGSVHKQQGDRVVPDRPLVIWYLHSLYLGTEDDSMPRISSHRTISKATIVYLSNDSKTRLDDMGVYQLIKGTPAASRATIMPPGDPWGVEEPVPITANPVRSQMNKQRRVNKRVAEDLPDAFADLIPDAQRARRYESEDDDPEEREETVAISKRVTDIVFNYPIQIFAKAPNRKYSRENWCTLDESERMKVDFNIFCDRRRVNGLFIAHFSFGPDEDKWNKTVRAYFPTPAESQQLRATATQGLRQLGVWLDWESLLASVPEARSRLMVKQARGMVNDRWEWLPYLGKEHLWATGKSGAKRATHFGTEEGGPWIVFNPRFHH